MSVVSLRRAVLVPLFFMCVGSPFSAPGLAAEVELSCPYKLLRHDLTPVYAAADLRIKTWRQQLKTQGEAAPIRQAMADYAINLLLQANALDSVGEETKASQLRHYVRGKLPDTDWRIQYQSRQGDLGSTEARISWLRSDAKPDQQAICGLAALGAAMGGKESLYRLALCVDSRDLALQRMRAASDRGHPAAIEAVERLCLAQRVDESCSFERLCLAAQAGRIGAAGTVGWRLTGGGGAASADGVSWLKRAAEAGDAIAQNNLGESIERNGTIVDSRDAALRWYRKAASAGLPAAMVNAARLLAEGNGLQCQEAQNYLAAAAQKGLAQAGEWAQSLHCP